MFRLITRTFVIVVVCIAFGLIALRMARASGIGYNLGPASSAQSPAAVQSSPQSSNADSASANAAPSSDIAATPLPGDTTEPQEQAEPQGQAEPKEPQEPQEQAEPQEQELSGIVASSDATHATFTLRTATGAVTVLVTSQTEFSDGLNTLAGVHAGMNVSVKGYSQTGHLVASDVQVSNANSDPSGASDSNNAADGN